MLEVASICGFDVGSENCYVAVARQGGIEILLNEYSQRSTPAYVCLGGKQRELGVSAKQKHMMNLNNTYFALKRVVGRQYNEVVQHEILTFPIEQAANGEVAVRVSIGDEEMVFTATQLLAMILSKLRQISHMVVDCVINCPNYFTDGQRRALRDAAYIAGLNPLRIVNDITATGINYSFYRLSSMSGGQDNAIVGFVDCGHTTTQCGIIYYDTKKNLMQVLSSECESDLGGIHFDQLLADYFIQQQNLKLSKKSRLRLIAECEKLKKQMSANSTDLPISVECLYDERDFSARMSRTLFEQLSEELLMRVRKVLERSLEAAKKTYASIRKDDKEKEKHPEFKINVVEVVGGTSRIPAIKRMVKEVFGLEASTTLNADEAVSCGCALQCAILSPSFKVAKELQIVDYAPYQINCKYWHATPAESKTYCINPLFQRGDQMPFTRQIIVTCHSLPMIFELEYVNEVNTAVIGQFKIFSDGSVQISSSSKIRVRVRLDNNGLVYVSSASVQMEDKSKKMENADARGDNGDQPTTQQPQPMDTDGANPSNHAGSDQGQAQDTNQTQPQDQKQNAANKESKASKAVTVDLLVEPLWVRGALSDADLQRCREIESNLILADKHYKERVDARNELEEYVYEWRSKMEEGRYDKYVVAADRQSFLNELQATEQWLYSDDVDEAQTSRSVYVDKLTALKRMYSDSVLFRQREHETRNSYLEELGKAIQMAHKILETSECGDEAKLKKLQQESEEKQRWFEQCHHTLSNVVLTCDPPITTKQIMEQTDSIQAVIRPVMEEIHRKRREKEKEEEKKRKEEEKKKRESELKEQNSAAESAEPMDVESGSTNNKNKAN